MENTTPTSLAPLTEATVQVPFELKISRLFVFRFLWMFLQIWVLYVWGVWLMILTIGQFFYQLFTGNRHQGLWNRMMRYFRHTTKWNAYFMWLSDKPPKFIED